MIHSEWKCILYYAIISILDNISLTEILNTILKEITQYAHKFPRKLLKNAINNSYKIFL